jgi:hypothetical protein
VPVGFHKAFQTNEAQEVQVDERKPAEDIDIDRRKRYTVDALEEEDDLKKPQQLLCQNNDLGKENTWVCQYDVDQLGRAI